ncbi:MAG: hypothetical protein HQM10_19195 [Candidatus Riflebacteria bacterium]|nr:hypothetical protein [Candidatus Riflebacteria bacterium]
MSLNIDFFPPELRQLGIGRKLPVTFLIAFILLLLFLGYLKNSLIPQRKALEAEKVELRKEEEKLMERAKKALVGAEEVQKVKEKISIHNYNLVEKRSRFVFILSQLEKILPENAVVIKMLESKTKTSLIRSTDSEFILEVLFEDLSTLPILHRRLTSGKMFSNVVINPKGKSSYLGRTGETIEVTFKVEET